MDRFAGLGWVLAPLLLGLALRLPSAAIGPDDVAWPVGVVDDRSMQDGLRTVSAPEAPWVLVVGGSSAFFAFDREALGVPARKQTHDRGFPSDVAHATAWTLRRSLPPDRRPTRVIWGLTLASLVDRQDAAIHPCATTVSTSREAPELAAATGLCDDLAAWGGPRARLERAWAGLDPWYARRAATQDLAVSWVRTLFGRPTPDPAPDDWHGYDGRDPERHARNTAAWERLGVFRADAIAAPHARTVAWLVATCRELGVPLTLVSMPEPSDLRARYAPGAREAFDALLAAQGVDTLDLFAAVPDDGFYDQAHLNGLGRRVATEALATHLRRSP